MDLVLETQRLQLIPIQENDLEVLHTIITDPYVRKYLCDDQIWPEEKVVAMLQENQKLFANQQLGLWFITPQELKKPIGIVGLWYFFEEEQPQLVYALLPEATKKGYATEAAKKVVDYWFQSLNQSYLLASCDKPNLASQKVAKRVGMIEVEERMIDNTPLIFFKIVRNCS